MLVRIDEIKLEHQFRAEMNPATVDEYAQALLDGVVFPPIDVRRLPSSFGFEGGLFLADGYHRLAAHKKIGREEIDAEVMESNEILLFEAAVSANSRHGLQRTQEDKRRAVRAALAHPVVGKRSDTQIAKLCGVSQPFVGKLRKDLRLDATIPKTAAAISEVLDLPLLESWRRSVPFDDKRHQAITFQIELIENVEKGYRWDNGHMVAHFPRVEACPTEWILSGDHAKAGPLLSLWLRKLDQARDFSIADEQTWNAEVQDCTRADRLWELAAAGCVGFVQRKQALLAGVQLRFVGQNLWEEAKLKKLTPATKAVKAKVDERLAFLEQRRQEQVSTDAPKFVDVSTWTLKHLQDESRITWNDDLRAECWKRAKVLELPLATCMGPRCAMPTPVDIAVCLRCGRWRAHNPSDHADAWNVLIQWHQRTKSPLAPLLVALLDGDPWNVSPPQKRALRQALEEGVVPGLKQARAKVPDDDASEDEGLDDDASEDEGLDENASEDDGLDDGGADD